MKNTDIPTSKADRAFIASIAAVTPSFSLEQSLSAEYLLEHYKGSLSPRSITLIRKLFSHPGVQKRYFAIEDVGSFLHEDPDSRAERFTWQSLELAERAISQALLHAGLTTDAVSGLVVNTCTGYVCPGLSTYLMERLGFARDIKVHDLVGSGCGGAIPNIEIACALLDNSSDKVVLSVSVEICSATFQIGDDLSLLVSNALFGDGAAAAVIWNRPEGLELITSSRCYVPEDRDTIRYVHKNGQLHNQLSTRLPYHVRHAVAQAVGKVLEANSLKIEDVDYWALHPGGEKIINTIRDEMGLPESKLYPTRKVLAEYGNMSSPTVWFVLNEILKQKTRHGELCMMVAFGAGLSAHAFLLKRISR